MTNQLTGRELDAAVAEKVMGWTMYHYDKDYAENCYWCLLDADGNAAVFHANYRDGEKRTEAEAWADCPKFSTDIAAAWQVVEAMDRNGFRFSIIGGLEYLEEATGEWQATFDDVEHVNEDGSTPDPVEAYGDTAPEAICRAALQAVTHD